MEAGTRRGVNHVQGSALTRSAKSARFQDYRTMEGSIGSNLLLGHGNSRLLFAGRFLQIENPTVRIGAVLGTRKSYGAVRCGFRIL